MTLGVRILRSFVHGSLFQIGYFIVARFLLRSTSHWPSTIAELLVVLHKRQSVGFFPGPAT